jgi:enediyne biosynthesis protein E4
LLGNIGGEVLRRLQASGPRLQALSFLTAFLLLLALIGCGGATTKDQRPTTNDSPWFVERAAESGLTLRHVNGMSGKFHYAELIAPGAALFDYDNDGDLDVYLVQGGALDGPQARTPSPHGRLFRNDLTVDADGARSLRFIDVTEASGMAARGYGMGAAAGDFNNDGCVDLYLTTLGPNTLLRSNCDGTFRDVSRASGTADGAWTVSASFVDYDRDGWLDLFSGNYLSWRVEDSAPCPTPSGRPDYCSPNVFQPQQSRLYRNNQNGTFTDVSAAAGIAHEFGPALGVSTADFNADGWPDVYVANDGQPNLLWMNQGNGTFKNLGLLSGTALSAHGTAKAGMGVDAGDVDNDGDEDLFVTNLTGEGNDLYLNDGAGYFEEQSARSGLGAPSRAFTGFGTAWFDIDNDGWLDTITVNGAVQTIESLRRANDPFPLHQRNLLFHNLGGGRFEDATARGGPAFALSEVGRGAAFGDVDNDGDVDVLVANNNGAPRLLLNQIGSRNHWVGLRLVGQGGRDMLGARVGIVLEDGRTLWRRARSDGSYASANDPRVLVGLGKATRVARVRVTWPHGTTEEWSVPAIDRYTTLREGDRR